MSRRFEQLNIEFPAWPKGVSRVAALLSLSPEDLAHRCTLEFFEGYDNLDYFRAAVILVDGIPYALVRHVGAPAPGTELWIRDSSTDPRGDVRRCLEALGLAEELISWEAE